jgi:hypothetical protein
MGTDLVKLSETISNTNFNSNAALLRFLEQVKDITIPLTTETVSFAEMQIYTLTFTAVPFSIKDTYDPARFETEPPKEIPKDCKRTFKLDKLKEIAQAAGLIITQSRIVKKTYDEKGNVDYIEHQVEWELLNLDGKKSRGKQEGKWNFKTDTAKFDKEKQKEKRRGFGPGLAESNAISRAIYAAIPKIPKTLYYEDFNKPLLVPRVIKDDAKLLNMLPDGKIKEKGKVDYIYTQLGMSKLLYSGDKEEVDEAEVIEDGSYEVEQDDIKEVAKQPEPQREVEPQEKKPAQPTPEEELWINAQTYKGAKQEERTAALDKLMKAVNKPFKEGWNVERFEKLTAEDQVKLIYNLMKDEYELKKAQPAA